VRKSLGYVQPVRRYSGTRGRAGDLFSTPGVVGQSNRERVFPRQTHPHPYFSFYLLAIRTPYPVRNPKPRTKPQPVCQHAKIACNHCATCQGGDSGHQLTGTHLADLFGSVCQQRMSSPGVWPSGVSRLGALTTGASTAHMGTSSARIFFRPLFLSL
jgi:hypothetical protein